MNVTEMAESKNKLADAVAERRIRADRVRKFAEYDQSEANPNGKAMSTEVFAEYNRDCQQHAMADKRVKDLELDIAHGERLLSTSKELDMRIDFNAASKAFITGSRQLTSDEENAILVKTPDGMRGPGGQKAPTESIIIRPFKNVVTRTGADSTTSAASAVDDMIVPNAIVESKLAYGGAMDLVSTMQSATGNDLSVVNVDTTAQEGELVGETSDVEPVKLDLPAPGSTTLGDYKYTSKLAIIKLQAIRDIAFNWEAWAQRSLVTRIYRAMEKHLTNGTGTDQPEGIANAVTIGLTTAATGIFTWQEISQFMDKIDDGYMMDGDPGHGFGDGGRIAFACSKSMFSAIKILADTQNRPLYMPGLHDNAEAMMYGYPVRRVYALPAADAGNEALLFGNFGYMLARHIGHVNALVFAGELAMAGKDQVGFMAFAECDSKWVQAKTASKVTAVQSMKIKA